MGTKVKNIVIGLNQLNISPGNIAENAGSIISQVKKLNRQKVDLMVFPEFSTTGYLLGDMWERPSFLKENELWIKKIIKATGPAITVFGTVITDWKNKGEDGRPRKFNSVVVAQNGKVLLNPALKSGHFPKTLLPNYREFEESRHFYDMRKYSRELNRPLEKLLVPLKVTSDQGPFKLGVTICEDAWGHDYGIHPFKILVKNGADLIVNASCSPFTRDKNSKRNRVFSKQAGELKTPIIYVNPVGLQNNGKTFYTFDGRCTVYNRSGKIAFEAPPYVSSSFKHTVFFQEPGPSLPPGPAPDKSAEIFAALRYGASHYLKQFKLKRVVIGISGGIDSALSAAIYGSFLKPGNLLLVNMPSKYNSSTTRTLAKRLAKNLGCFYAEVPIQKDVSEFTASISRLKGKNLKTDRSLRFRLSELNIQNIQSRERSSRILAALASALGGVFSCNANKAELTVGYSTLYGDIGGHLALLGDLWKEDVYALSEYINNKIYRKKLIPSGILDLPPSAELGEDHNIDKGQGDPLNYPYHDKLFFSWVQRWNRLTPEDILAAYSRDTLEKMLGLQKDHLKNLFKNPGEFIEDLERWWGMYNGLGAVKRVQAPPVLAVSSRAFGFDHREPIGTAYYTERYLKLRDKLLNGSR